MNCAVNSSELEVDPATMIHTGCLGVPTVADVHRAICQTLEAWLGRGEPHWHVSVVFRDDNTLDVRMLDRYMRPIALDPETKAAVDRVLCGYVDRPFALLPRSCP